MLAWISSIIISFVGGRSVSTLQNSLDSEKILCVNTRGIHFVEPVCGCEKVLHLRNKLLGNKKIRYIRRQILGSKRHIVRQILKTTGIDGEYFLSTLS